LQTSEHFAEGEEPEEGIQIGEKLSRESTPTEDDGLQDGPERLEAGTPDLKIGV
jgi:hypothetical protein